VRVVSPRGQGKDHYLFEGSLSRDYRRRVRHQGGRHIGGLGDHSATRRNHRDRKCEAFIKTRLEAAKGVYGKKKGARKSRMQGHLSDQSHTRNGTAERGLIILGPRRRRPSGLAKRGCLNHLNNLSSSTACLGQTRGVASEKSQKRSTKRSVAVRRFQPTEKPLRGTRC